MSVTAPFPARFPGSCDDCGERFAAGDLIRYASSNGEDGTTIHAVCPEPLTVGRNERVCPRCFVTHAGEC